MVPHGVSAFLEKLATSPSTHWLAAREPAGGMGVRLAQSAEEVEVVVDALGYRKENELIEGRINGVIDGLSWFAEASEGVHGITSRDLAGMRLLAIWAALAILAREHLSADSYEVLTDRLWVDG